MDRIEELNKLKAEILKVLKKSKLTWQEKGEALQSLIRDYDWEEFNINPQEN